MKRRPLHLSAALLLLAAPVVQAQRAPAFEVGAFAQYSKFDSFTGLSNGVGFGARAGVYLLRNIALEYEGDFTSTKSDRVGNLTALNNRIDAIAYFPLGGRLHFLAGGGFTGTQYHGDTTGNRYDSGGNAVAGLKYCVSQDWAVRGDVNADFKNPSDQTPSGQRTTTYNFRIGISRFLGGPATNSPCYEAPPPPPAPAPPPPAPAPMPTPAPVPPPAPKPAPKPPVPVQQPAPEPPPAPVKRELLVLHGAHFAFDKSSLTPVAKDTLQRVVAILNVHADANVEIQGYTDNIGTAPYNQALSVRRAEAVKEYLVSKGISADRITVRGFGETQPVADNHTSEGRAANRRVVIIEVP